MPGYILHLTAAKFYLNQLPKMDPLRSSSRLRNDFYMGNLLPDAGKDKTLSHFRDPRFENRMIEWPRPEVFAAKYRDLLQDASCFGYWFHLQLDQWFLQEYLSGVVRFLDREEKETVIRSEVVWAVLQKTGERIPLEKYLSEEYYYGDYTKMNTWLSETFNLPLDLEVPDNPGIEEVDYKGGQKVLKQLEEYRKVPAGAVRNLRVFEMEDLLAFLQKSACRFDRQKGVR